MKPLDAEQHRILLDRITAALTKAKYEPATVAGKDGPNRVAREVLRPYEPRLKAVRELADALSERVKITEAAECFPMNSAGGLYISVLCQEGRLTDGELYDICKPIARKHGYNPDGSATIGAPTIHGVKSITYAVWFHDKEKR